MIELRSFGALELTADGRPVGSVLAQPRRAALLCYLAIALPRGFHRRDTLFALFWPDHDAEQARHALRQSVYFLRRALGPGAIESRGDDELAVAPAMVRCDVREFERALDEGRMEDGLALYAGELLAGFHISDAPDYERWLDAERTRLRERAQDAAWKLAAAREAASDFAGAAEVARRAAALAPADEIALRRLVLLLERVGDRAGAVRAWEAFAARLREEYELEPSAETQALGARIRAESAERPPAAPQRRETSPMPEVVPAAPGPASRQPPPRSRRLGRLAAGTAASVLALGLAGFPFRAQFLDRPNGRAASAGVEPSLAIAVLPFVIQDDVPANLREGLMDLVAMNLGGIPGLRAVDSRSLMARRREGIADTADLPLAAALDVARRAGGRYAVVPRVIAAGGDLIVTAGVHDLLQRRALGTARTHAPADSLFRLVDDLTIGVLRLIPRDDGSEPPQVDLARINTSSLPALRAYMEGEALYRRMEFERAAEAYRRAVEADSGFVMARFRLGLARQWFWDFRLGQTGDPVIGAVGQYADRLPQHEAAMLRAIQVRHSDLTTARSLLEEEARRFPEDADTWYQLSELYFHLGPEALAPPEAATRALSRAIALDSSFSPPYLHRIECAIKERDIATIHRLIDAFRRVAPAFTDMDMLQLLAQIAFGDSTAHSTAMLQLDTLNAGKLRWIAWALAEAGEWRYEERALQKMRERRTNTTPATVSLVFNRLALGKAAEANRLLDDPLLPAFARPAMLQWIVEAGAPEAVGQRTVALPLDSDSTDVVLIFYGGAAAAAQGEWPLFEDALTRLRSRAPRFRAARDSSEADFIDAVRQGLEGYALWRRGHPDRALPLIQASQRRAVGDSRRDLLNQSLRWWAGQLLVELDRPEHALPYLESLRGNWRPVDFERGRVYERLGRNIDAQEAYAQFLAPRDEADDLFRPMIDHARAAIERLAAAGTE